MTTTTHYSITYIEAGQAGKYITCNEAFDTIDAALYALSVGGGVTLAGDVTGTSGANTVTKIRGVAVSATAPTTSQYLQYNGSTWLPATLSVTLAGDVTGGYGANTVTKLRGVTVASTSPTNGYVLAYNSGTTQWEPTAPTVTSSVTMGGDVTGNSATSTVAKLQGRTVASTGPSDLQYLGWNNGSTQWEPKTIAITLAGDVTGAYGTNTVTKLQNVAVSATTPTTNQYLQYNGTNWLPVTFALTLAGDVTGGYGANTVAKLQGRTVASTSPTDGQLLAWNNGATQWEPTTAPFDLSTFLPGKPSNSLIVLKHVFARATAFAGNLSGSYAHAEVAATGSTVYDVKKNGSSTGSITFAASGTTATFTTTSGAALSFAAGDRITIVAPASADATLSDVAITLKGTR